MTEVHVGLCCQLHYDSNGILCVILLHHCICCHLLLWATEHSVGRRKTAETWVRSQCSTDLARSQPSKSHLHKKHSWKACCNFLWDLRNTVGSRSVSGPCKSWKGTSDISFQQSISLFIDRPESSLANISCSLWHVTNYVLQCVTYWTDWDIEVFTC